jgi:hypothetical protein
MKYIIKKRGYFYRQRARGYTDNILEAGIYTEEEARLCEDNYGGVFIFPLSEVKKSFEKQLEKARNFLAEIDSLASQKVIVRCWEGGNKDSCDCPDCGSSLVQIEEF